MKVTEELLKMYKQSIGDFNATTLMDSYYSNFLKMAIADLESDDIGEVQLSTTLGQSAICLYAEALMNKTDIATNPTITLLRNKLSDMTKGDRADV